MTSKPVLAVTLGDVAGIGPEITARMLLGHPDLRSECVPVVIGDADAMRRGVQTMGGDASAIRVIGDPLEAANEPERPLGPYNLLIARGWMLLVPRTRERFGTISVNALGFAGSLFVRDAAEMDALRAAGPMSALRAVAVPY